MNYQNNSPGTLMLIALVVSQMPVDEKKEPKFIDFIPEPRKKRKYSK